MKTYLLNIGLSGIILIFIFVSFSQCSQKNKALKNTETALIEKQKAEAEYLDLVKLKTRIDTLWKEGKTKVIHKTDFKTITDTLFVDHDKVYGLFKDSIINQDLTLHADIVASDLHSIDYTYSVREKIITQQSILTEHDTLIQQVRKGQLIGLADIGMHSYSAGLQYQTRKRIGFTARYNWYQSDGFVSIGVDYRIF